MFAALSPVSAEADNLLTNNADFDSGPTTYFAGIQTNDNGQVPGWPLTINSDEAVSSFTEISNDQGKYRYTELRLHVECTPAVRWKLIKQSYIARSS